MKGVPPVENHSVDPVQRSRDETCLERLAKIISRVVDKLFFSARGWVSIGLWTVGFYMVYTGPVNQDKVISQIKTLTGFVLAVTGSCITPLSGEF